MKLTLSPQVRNNLESGKIDRRDAALQQLVLNSSDCLTEISQIRNQLGVLRAAVDSLTPAKKNDDLDWIQFE